MTTIIDYGLGNVQAIENVYKRLHIPVRLAKGSDELNGAEKLILPGVGSFDHAMERFTSSGMRETVTDMVHNKKIPVLGICVGMQMLANKSDEGVLAGLGWVNGTVRALNSVDKLVKLPLPHMGWNDVLPRNACPLFKEIENDSRFYFLHSYFFECNTSENIAAEVEYGMNFTCAVAKDNIFGVQFHPEKSHHYGTTLLRNFARL